MPSTTTNGLPIPLDTDPMADLALAIRNLANAFDTPNTGWVSVATSIGFSGTWVNFGGVYSVLQYKRVGPRIYIRGTIKSGTSGTAVFTLPVGFRPPTQIRLAIDCAGGHGFAEVQSSGVVTVTGATTNVHFNHNFEVA